MDGRKFAVVSAFLMWGVGLMKAPVYSETITLICASVIVGVFVQNVLPRSLKILVPPTVLIIIIAILLHMSGGIL